MAIKIMIDPTLEIVSYVNIIKETEKKVFSSAINKFAIYLIERFIRYNCYF